MSKSYRVTLQAALLFLALVLVAGALAVAIVDQREKELADTMHDWPVKDAGYQDHLRLPEGDLPALSLIIIENEPGAMFLAAQVQGLLYLTELPPTVLLSSGEERLTASELGDRGLPVLLESLAGHYGLPVSHCFGLDCGETADPPADEDEAHCAGSRLLEFGASWREEFSRKGLLLDPGTQTDLAGTCLVDPDLGYRNLQAWGESLRELDTSSIRTLPLLTSGWKVGEQELDGRAYLDILAMVGRGEDPALYIQEHEAAREEERKARTLSNNPVTPAIIYGGYANRMEVAITLDDGYNQDPRVLELLQSYGIRCTVFPVGRFAEQNVEWLKLLDAMGFEIANHSYTHPIHKPNRLIDLPDEAVYGEILAAQQVVWDAVGKQYPYFRPPGGWVDERIAALAADLGYVTVMWSLDSGDTGDPNTSPLDRANTILSKVKPGYILLFHFGGYYTYETLKYLIPRMQGQGYHFVTLSQLFKP